MNGDWGDGPVQNVLARQARRPEFDSQTMHFKKSTMAVHARNPSSDEAEADRFLGLSDLPASS